MAITIHPRPGQILYCDFSNGFKEPEIVKNRPVVILTPAMNGRPGLVTVVPISSKRPDPKMPFHCLLPKASLPMTRDFQDFESWVKADMLYAVGLHRLDLIKLGKRGPDGKRLYYRDRCSRERMRQIYSCVLAGLNMASLAAHIPE